MCCARTIQDQSGLSAQANLSESQSDFVQVHVIVSLIVFANLEQTKITYILT